MPDAADGLSAHINIFLRVRPSKRASGKFSLDQGDARVAYHIPRDELAGYVNNQRETYEFRFNGVIPPEAKQDEVFERVARNSVTGALEGINGTIFAYGQTGSGKTFTITGGAERYVDRGIIPRSLSMLFEEMAKRSDTSFTVGVSYLEIYQDYGYDLLDPEHEAKRLEDLPKVAVQEDDGGNLHMRNLGIHRATNEEEALNLLFLGDTNRTIAETPMNLASSRSHCIFTVHVEARKHGSDTVRRSKLNLVDLAGSERVNKTGVTGALMQEAKYINVSLHFLEQVIVALQERSMGQARPHIPYRNSMLTMCLRDSLGGNCRTSMVATVSCEDANIDESISTCRFAQRVAMVSNVVMVNEDLDPSLVIKRLKQEIKDLKEEIRVLRGDGYERGPLTEDEVLRMKDNMLRWVQDDDDESRPDLAVGTMEHIRAAMKSLKTIAREGGGAGGGRGGVVMSEEDASALESMKEELRKLRLQVQQRDNEINILVGMMRKGGGGAAPALRRSGEGLPAGAGAGAPVPTAAGPAPGAGAGGAPASPAGSASSAGSGAQRPEDLLANTDILADRASAFELFRKSYRKNAAIEENKMLLKEKYKQAKAIGESVNEHKRKIEQLKAVVEQRRLQRSVRGAVDGEDDAEDAEEIRARKAIDDEKAQYKAKFATLRELKSDIERLTAMLENSRKKLTGDFEAWLTVMLRQQANGGVRASVVGAANHPGRPSALAPAPAVALASPGGPPKEAWGAAPPVVAPHLSPPRAPQSPSRLASVASPNARARAAPLMTGNSQADQDILAFYEARERLLARGKAG